MDEEKVRILVIEDEKPIAKILEYDLKKEGYEVRLAHTGADGMREVDAFEPHLILLDWMLPDLSGADILKILVK